MLYCSGLYVFHLPMPNGVRKHSSAGCYNGTRPALIAAPILLPFLSFFREFAHGQPSDGVLALGDPDRGITTRGNGEMTGL